jgi:uncharacterized membrane protein YbaN (DUF454 family)
MQLGLRNLSSWTMFIFGAMALVLGAIGIFRPEITLSLTGFDILERGTRDPADYTLVFITTSSMASFNVGAYYILASLTNWKPFYWWTVPFRWVTVTVFILAVVRGLAPTGFIGVAIWELVGSLATGAALLYERRQT